MEPTEFSTQWYSHKHHGPGVRYEVAVSITSGHIVWVYGPFPCGGFNDLSIFRSKLKGMILPGERIIADRGYKDEVCDYVSQDMVYQDKFYSTVRARHEAVNRRIKQFNVVSQRFRHKLSLHFLCFQAAANLTQLMIENGAPLFEI